MATMKCSSNIIKEKGDAERGDFGEMNSLNCLYCQASFPMFVFAHKSGMTILREPERGPINIFKEYMTSGYVVGCSPGSRLGILVQSHPCQTSDRLIFPPFSLFSFFSSHSQK